MYLCQNEIFFCVSIHYECIMYYIYIKESFTFFYNTFKLFFLCLGKEAHWEEKLEKKCVVLSSLLFNNIKEHQLAFFYKNKAPIIFSFLTELSAREYTDIGFQTFSS